MEEARLLEESSIVGAVRSGNADAFDGIIERYHVPIVRYLYRITGDADLADDLAQDTFVQAYKAILKTDSTLKLKAWLYRIATNNAAQHFRRKKLVSFVHFDHWHEPNTARRPEQQSEMVEETLRKVPGDLRACLVLHYVEGFKYAEIAGTLGISEEAVRKRVARGKESFRRLYRGGDKG